MKVADLNPHLRFAEQITYSAENNSVYVRDCRLFYIINGDAQIIIDDSAIPLTPNTLFYCCCGTKYTIKSNKPIVLYSLNFDLSRQHCSLTQPIPGEFADKINTPIDKHSVTDSDFLNSFMVLKNAVEFKKAFSDISNEYTAQKTYFRETCSSMLKLLLINLHKINTNSPGTPSETVNKIIEYINSNYTNEIHNAELAEIVGYHEYYLNKIFKNKIGVSIHKYILNLRINEGKHLLLNTNLSISDISSRIGFNSNTHFSTYFKKETGLTPFEYRNNFKNII